MKHIDTIYTYQIGITLNLKYLNAVMIRYDFFIIYI